MTVHTPRQLWFGVSLALMGVIIGYGIAVGTNGGTKTETNQPPQVAQKQQAQPTPAPSPSAPAAQNVPPVDPEKDHIRGNPDATIAVIEYSDFECPFCKRHHPTMSQIVEEYDGKVSWVYRHFPLPFHPNAQPSAEAAECANDQGGNNAFWQYTDLLFERGADKNNLISYAEELGLDTNAFESCLNSGKYTRHVNEDTAGGSAAGISGTPGNIIYNLQTKEARLLSGAQPFENFKTVIDEMLVEKAKAKEANIPSNADRTQMVHVSNWSFTPETITAKEGEKLSLHFMGIEGNHGFAIPALGISASIPQGESTVVAIPTDTPGTYEFFCNVPCGDGHKDMKGTLTIL